MQRIHAPFDEPTLAQIDKEVEKKGISRAQWLTSVVGAYLRLLEATNGADPTELVSELRQAKLTNESQWKENQTLKRSEEKAREDVAQGQRKLDALEDQIAATQSELEKARSDMILFDHDKAHYLDTIAQKDQHIAFLEAHLANITQSIGQLALKPSEEEAKKRGWWQFWK